MALAGAGNPVGGSNPSGTGGGLKYIGNHAYYMSGNVGVNNVETTLGEFATGEQYVNSIIQFHAVTDSSDDMRYTIKINGETVVSYIVNDSTGGASTPDNPIYLLLPSFSTIELLSTNETSSGTQNQNVTITGRVY